MALENMIRGSFKTADYRGPELKKRTDFFFGRTITDRDEALLWSADRGGDGNFYLWDGALPKAVPAGSTPATSGGVAAGAWVIAPLHGRDVINVKEFGAKGDFATDDTAAINKAMAYAAAYSDRGAVVYFPAGIYNVSSSLIVPQFVTLQGAGKQATVIRCTAAGTAVDPIVWLPNSNSNLRGIGVVYASLQTAQGTCIRSTGASNSLSDFMCSAGYIGIQLHTGTAIVCDDFAVYDCKRIGILIGETAAGFVNDIILTNYFVISGDQTNFNLGAMRVIGQVEALICKSADLIGSATPFTSDPGATPGLRFSSFEGIYFDSGLQPATFTGVNHTDFTSCWFSNRNTGAVFVNCHSLTFAGAKAYNNNLGGMIFNNCHHIHLAGDFSNNNTTGAASTDDIFFDALCTNMIVGPLVGFEPGLTRSGVFIANGAFDYKIRSVEMSPRATAIVIEPAGATGRKVDGVRGYVTQNRGSATLPGSATSVVVAHGLNYAPTIQNLQVTPNGHTTTPLYVSAVSATDFTVSTQTSNAGAVVFSWMADASI